MYNCLPTTKSKVQVYLGITGRDCNCNHLSNLMQTAADFADDVNQICNETLTTILIQRYPFERCQLYTSICKSLQDIKESDVKSLSVYSWGLMTSYNKYCNEKLRLYFRPTLVMITYENEESMLSRNLTQCKTYTGYPMRPLTFIKKVSFPDTDNNCVVKVTKFVNSWKTLLDENNNTTYLISKAFDTPRPLSLKYQTNGWWYLVRDSRNKNTTEFVFKEKQSEASKVDYEENVRNFNWLQKDTKFDKSSTGIIYTGEISLNVIRNDFCQILCLQHKLDTFTYIHTFTLQI